MGQEVTYYLGRVLKFGHLDSSKLMDSIEYPEFVIVRNNGWTFIDVKRYKNFIVGALAKYAPEGEFNIIDIEEHSRKVQKQPNLLLAQSAFIYIPEFSGLAFQHIPSQIEPKTFANRFAKVIKETNKDFFMDCEVEMISDIRTFAVKLSKLTSIREIAAKVNPPNPLFGNLWAPLKDYLKNRNIESLSIAEKGSKEKPLETKLKKYVEMLANIDGEPNPEEKVPIGDSAILMAADGYGEGIVVGDQNGKPVTIKTSKTIKNFSQDKSVTHDELYKDAFEHFKSINKERYMKHE